MSSAGKEISQLASHATVSSTPPAAVSSAPLPVPLSAASAAAHPPSLASTIKKVPPVGRGAPPPVPPNKPVVPPKKPTDLEPKTSKVLLK
jgi:hypothetical protein